jgi:hypothetical protein
MHHQSGSSHYFPLVGACARAQHSQWLKYVSAVCAYV